MRQAQILLSSRNLTGGVSQPHQEAPGGLGGAGQTRRAARLPGSLSPGHGPHVPGPGGWRVVSLQKAVHGRGCPCSLDPHDLRRCLWPPAQLVGLELGSVVRPGAG